MSRAASVGQDAGRTRDAARSRQAILDAAERLFGERGFDGVSMGDIAAGAGLSRAMPNYLFGSKDALYTAVLQRVFHDRQAATAAAVAPIVEWCDHGGDHAALRRALIAGIDGYMTFLLSRPTFSRFISWEELAGGGRLRATERRSTALTDAFTALHRVGDGRGLRPFTVPNAVLLWVTLTFAALAHRHTMLAGVGRDLTDARIRREHTVFVADQLMFLLTGEAAEEAGG